MSKLINEIRFYNFISGVLCQQQTDPFCRDCKAFENTAARMKEGLSELEDLLTRNTEPVSPAMRALINEARIRLEGLTIPVGAVGQKKAGRCGMPEGVCFIKLSKAIRDKI
jgi:hypothetical protein